MKFIFVSDIHGNVDGLERVIEILKNEQADRLIILGDTANSYDEIENEKICDILNSIKDKVEVIRGNCDTISFEDKLEFEIFDDDVLYVNGKSIAITHGHRYHNREFNEDIFIQGHTHIPVLRKENKMIFANPGSITRPRGSDLKCYLLLNEQEIILKTLDGKIVNKIEF